MREQLSLLEVCKKILVGDDTIENLESLLPDDSYGLEYELSGNKEDGDTILVNITSISDIGNLFNITEYEDFFYGSDSNDDYFYHDAYEIFNDGNYFYMLGEKNKQDLTKIINVYFDDKFNIKDEVDAHKFLEKNERLMGKFMENLKEEYAYAYSEENSIAYDHRIENVKEEVFSKLKDLMGMEFSETWSGYEFEFPINRLMLFLAAHNSNASNLTDLFATNYFTNITSPLNYAYELRYEGGKPTKESQLVVKNFQENTLPELLKNLVEYLEDTIDERRDLEKVTELGKRFNFNPFAEQTQTIKTPNKPIIYQGFNPIDGTHMVGVQSDNTSVVNTKVVPISTERLVQLLTNYEIPGIFNESLLRKYSFI